MEDNETKWWVIGGLTFLVILLGAIAVSQLLTHACYKTHSSRPTAELIILCRG